MKTGERDNLFRIFVGTEVRGTLGSVRTSWSEAGREWGGFVPAHLTMRSYGAGEAPAGLREVEFRAPSRVTERVGLEAIAGPFVGTKWRVVAVDPATPGRITTRVEPYTGEFE